MIYNSFRLHKDNTVTKCATADKKLYKGFRLHKDNTVTKL